ncbi:MAG: type II secretion system F family protein [Acidobacteriaceae bacterium]
MILLASVFGLIFVLTFGIVVIGTAPSREEKIFEHRLASIGVIKSGALEVQLEASQLLRKRATSHFGWVEEALVNFAPMQRFRRYVMQAGINATAASVLAQMVIFAVVGYFVVLFFVRVLPIDVGGALVIGFLPLARIIVVRYRRMRAFDKSLAHAIDMMARALRAGHSVAGAIELVAEGSPAPAKGEFGEVFRQQNFGMPLRDALLQMVDRVPSQDLRVMVTAIIVQRETGGNLVEILDRTVFVIRERQRIQGEIRTQTAQGRLTGWILTMLPVVMGLLINVVDPGYSHILFTSPLGRKMIYVGLGMITLGGYFINRIINGIDV